MLEGRQLTENEIYFTSIIDTGKSKVKTLLALLLYIRWRGERQVLTWQKSWRVSPLQEVWFVAMHSEHSSSSLRFLLTIPDRGDGWT